MDRKGGVEVERGIAIKKGTERGKEQQIQYSIQCSIQYSKFVSCLFVPVLKDLDSKEKYIEFHFILLQ